MINTERFQTKLSNTNEGVFTRNNIPSTPKFTLILHSNMNINMIVDGDLSDLIRNNSSLRDYLNSFTSKEELYLTGIRNLIKTKKFLQLCIQQAEQSIDENEFESEITENRDNYVISMRSIKNLEELKTLNEIITKIDKQFNVEEVSEIFSISSDSIIKNAQNLL